jgi:hypothetical protein
MTQLLHQLGHQYQWNLQSHQNDHTGDGVIVGPRYMDPDKLSGIPYILRKQSFFDPQFFLPNSARGKLQKYSFFPDVLAGGFTTTEWSPVVSSECANGCVEFQRSMGFGSVVIPTRFYEGMPSDYISKQEHQFVTPFLACIGDLKLEVPVYLQLILTDQMLKDKPYREQILNWVTSFPEVSGVYLIYHVHNRQKQIGDIDLLMSLMSFISALKAANMSVVVGYTNAESALLLCAGPDAVTMGSYENLRMFNLRSFEEADGSVRRGPNARVYIPRLLEWVEYQYIGAIRRVVGDIDEYIGDDSYRMSMFEPKYNWHFTKREPYMHYFKSFTMQFQRLSSPTDGTLIDKVLAECQQAHNEFRNLREKGVVFPSGSGGEHIAGWITTINLWRREAGI